MLQVRKTQLLLAVLLFLISGQLAAADERSAWLYPSSQTMYMDSEYSSMLTDYKNMERIYSVKTVNGNIDIFYLRGFVLVRGFSDSQIEKLLKGSGLFMLPMNIALPVPILMEAAPNGPFDLKEETPFSIKLSGGCVLQGRKMSSAAGHIHRVDRYNVSYEFDLLTDPPLPNNAAVRFSGTMSFAPKQAAPSDDIDVTGYTVVRQLQIVGVAGSQGVPSKLGQLRSFISSGNLGDVPIKEK